MVKQVLKRILPEKFVWWLGNTFPPKPFMYDIAQTERIIEYGWAYRNLPPTGTVLDVGASGSMFAHSLASMGYNVTTLDWKKPKSTHPNICYIQKDLMLYNPLGKFDVVTCISTLEHIALRVDWQKVVEKMLSFLQPDGILLITVPCGFPKVLNGFKVFHPGSFKDCEYFKRLSKGVWVKTDLCWDLALHVNMQNKDEVTAILCTKLYP